MVVAQTAPSALPPWDRPADEHTLVLGWTRLRLFYRRFFPSRFKHC